MTELLSAYMDSELIFGVSAINVATAVSLGFCEYAITSLTVESVDVGAVGAGVGAGVGIFISSSALIASLTSSFESAGIHGPMKNPLISAISNTVSDMLKLSIITTVNAGVGIGTGKVSVIPSPSSSIPIMMYNFLSLGLIGIASPTISKAIAQGIDQAMISATGFIIISGPAGPSPGVGTGIGKIF